MTHFMGCFKLRGNLLVLALISASFFYSNSKAEEQAGNPIAFRWAFGAMVGPAQERRFTAITGDTALATGDQLKFLVELQQKCFVYLIYRSSQGDVNMLFPYDLNQYGRDFEFLKMYYIPRDDSWFQLDEKSGVETFYLIASASRLHELEALFRKATSGADGNLKRPELILSHIKGLKKRHRTLTASAERPVPIGGNVRGINPDVQTKPPDMGAVAIEVSAQDFYCRTFTIEHK